MTVSVNVISVFSDRRRELLPKMHQAKRDGKTSWLSYDTLYIDGRPVRSER